jgi:ubiquinone/menaquinone biosynthesis C-methylase UbiE
MYYWKNFIEQINSILKPGDILLDAGAGDCHWRQYFPSAKYLGMDLAVGDSEWDYSQLDITGDLRNIPLTENSVDTIICIEVLEHLPEPWKVITEFNRVLSKKGYLFLTCPQSHHQHQVPYDFFRYTPFGLRSLLESNGFEVLKIKPQLGNFNHIYSEFSYSAKKLPQISKNPLSKAILKGISIHIRAILALHKPLMFYFDRFEPLQDSPAGHFLMARKL